MFRYRLGPMALALAFALFGSACEDDEPTGPAGPFDLTFSGDATFQTPHGGQTIYVALVRASDGTVVARQTGTVASSGASSFSFTFTNLLQSGTAYQVHYWIDSNFGGGSAGACDPPANDHQWSIAVAAPTMDVTITDTHRPASTQNVCTSFETVNLTFAGDMSFNPAHTGDAISLALIRASDGVVVARASGTIANANPSYSFTFTGALVLGSAYEVHYWIDSNFGGGTLGACDPPATDHQWNVAIPAVTAAVTITDTHRPASTEDVCGSFPTASLTFAGDATFQTPHDGQAISAALVRSTDGAVLARQSGTVSGTADPSFSFDFGNALVVGVPYEVHYWIDSNFGGGAAGTCDPPANDHQWSVSLMTVTDDVAYTDTHRPADTESVCASFPTASLTFGGDATFQTPHGGQDIHVAVVRSTDGATVGMIQSGTVSGTADPSFSFDFTDGLIVGVPYEVHYWIDSNFGGGAAGTCDPPANDHQWNVPLMTIAADVTYTDTHRPADTESVCSTFP